MNWWQVAAAIIAAIVVWTIFENWRERKRQDSLAASRQALTSDQFINEMQIAGVKGSTAAFLFDEIGSYYFHPLQPDPSDRVYTTLAIDPEDIADIVEKHWRNLHGSVEPAEVVSIPQDASLVELGRFLDGLSDIDTEPETGGR